MKMFTDRNDSRYFRHVTMIAEMYPGLVYTDINRKSQLYSTPKIFRDF